MLKVIKKGLAFTYSFVVAQKLLRFAQMLVLVRLLSPDDFGLSAIVLVVYGSMNALIQSGIKKAIVQSQSKDSASLNTAWCFSIARGVLLFMGLYLTAPFFGDFFSDQKVSETVQFISFVFLVSGFTNIGMVLCTIDLQFKRVLVWEFLSFCVGVIVTLYFAIALENYWAIIYGVMAEQITRCCTSYYFSSYKPNFVFDYKVFLRLFRYGKWMAADKIISFVTSNQDKVFIGKLLGVEQLGYYSVANQLPVLLASLYSSLSRIFFPVFSKINKESVIDSGKIEIFLLLIVTTASQFVIVVFFFSEIIVGTFYGDNWLLIAPYLEAIIFISLLNIVQTTMFSYFNGVGKPNYVFSMNLFRMVLLFPCLYFLVSDFGIYGVVYSYLLVQVISIPFMFYFINRISSVSFYRLAYLVFPVVTAIVVSLTVDHFLQQLVGEYLIIKPILSIIILLSLLLIVFRLKPVKEYVVGTVGV